VRLGCRGTTTACTHAHWAAAGNETDGGGGRRDRGRDGGGEGEGEREGREREGEREEGGKGTLGLGELERSNLSLEVTLPSNLITLLARQRMYILRVICIYVNCACMYVCISTYVRT
jgi:hypothetical protein